MVPTLPAPLFSANAETFRRRAPAAVDEQPEPVRWFVLDAEADGEAGITALDAVGELHRELTRRGVAFALARGKQDPLDDLTAYGLADTVGRERISPTPPTAVAADRRWCRGQQTARSLRSAGLAGRGPARPGSGASLEGLHGQSRQEVFPVPYDPAADRVVGPVFPDPWGPSAPLRPAPANAAEMPPGA
ncbi:sodium-independent anion transporter [Streptomyces sp. NPDC002486]